MNPGKGYRWLKVGETLQPTDEWNGQESGIWWSVGIADGLVAQFPKHYRRIIQKSMPSLIPTDPGLVPQRVATPHKQLKPGRHIMSWCGYEVLVDVRIRAGRPVFQVPTGLTHEVYTVPDAKFYRLPEGMQ